jgi:RNA polymerase sigma-B factor
MVAVAKDIRQASSPESSDPGDVAHRNEAINAHSKLVHKIAHRMLKLCNEPYEDICQVGFLGLVKAIDRFDESLGNAFSSFAVPYIEGEIRHYLRDQAPSVKAPRSALEKHSHIRRLRKHFTNLNRQINESEIAQKIGLSEKQWQFLEQVNCGALSVSLDELPYEPKAEEEQEENHSAVYQALSSLSSRHRYVISQRFFLGQSIAEIAKKLKKSTTEIESDISTALYLLNTYISKNVG